jgi:hypothetical protein
MDDTSNESNDDQVLDYKVESLRYLEKIQNRIDHINNTFGKRADVLMRRLTYAPVINFNFDSFIGELRSLDQFDNVEYVPFNRRLLLSLSTQQAIIESDLVPKYQSNIGHVARGADPHAQQIYDALLRLVRDYKTTMSLIEFILSLDQLNQSLSLSLESPPSPVQPQIIPYQETPKRTTTPPTHPTVTEIPTTVESVPRWEELLAFTISEVEWIKDRIRFINLTYGGGFSQRTGRDYPTQIIPKFFGPKLEVDLTVIKSMTQYTPTNIRNLESTLDQLVRVIRQDSLTEVVENQNLQNLRQSVTVDLNELMVRTNRLKRRLESIESY